VCDVGVGNIDWAFATFGASMSKNWLYDSQVRLSSADGIVPKQKKKFLYAAGSVGDPGDAKKLYTVVVVKFDVNPGLQIPTSEHAGH
jgi:hypothetical protein